MQGFILLIWVAIGASVVGYLVVRNMNTYVMFAASMAAGGLIADGGLIPFYAELWPSYNVNTFALCFVVGIAIFLMTKALDRSIQ